MDLDTLLQFISAPAPDAPAPSFNMEPPASVPGGSVPIPPTRMDTLGENGGDPFTSGQVLAKVTRRDPRTGAQAPAAPAGHDLFSNLAAALSGGMGSSTPDPWMAFANGLSGGSRGIASRDALEENRSERLARERQLEADKQWERQYKIDRAAAEDKKTAATMEETKRWHDNYRAKSEDSSEIEKRIEETKKLARERFGVGDELADPAERDRRMKAYQDWETTFEQRVRGGASAAPAASTAPAPATPPQAAAPKLKPLSAETKAAMQKAIAEGRDPDLVRKRVIDNGFDPDS